MYTTQFYFYYKQQSVVQKISLLFFLRSMVNFYVARNTCVITYNTSSQCMTWIQSTKSYWHNRKCPNPCASNSPLCFAVPYVYFVWKGLFVENIMSIIFEFPYSNKFHSIFNLFLLYSSLFSHFSVRFVVCLQAKKRSRFIFTAGRQKFPTRFCVGKQREKGSTRDWF